VPLAFSAVAQYFNLFLQINTPNCINIRQRKYRQVQIKENDSIS